MSSDAGLGLSLSHLRRFLGYVLRHFPLARLTIVLSLLMLALEYTLLSVMIPLASVSDANSGGRITAFWSSAADLAHFPRTQMTWLWFFLILTAASVIVGYVHVVLSTWLAKQVHRSLSERIFHRVLFDEPMIEIYRRSIGYYITLAGDDTSRAGTIILSTLQTFAAASSALAGFVLLYLFSSQVFVGAILFLVVCGAVVGWGFRSVLRTNERSVELSRELGTAYIEGLNGLRSIRSMSSEQFVHRSYMDGLRRYVRLLFQVDATRGGMKLVPGIVLLGVAVIALWPRSSLGMELTVGYFLGLTTIVIRVFMSLGQVVQSGSTLLLDVRAAKDIDELVGEATPSAAVSTQPGHVRSIALQGVTFTYPGAASVLRDFSFRIEAGRTYAIVGRSGSGKSTLADLLLGLITPDRGEVVVNDEPVSASLLRRHVVLVEQQARIFSASVRENLLLGLDTDDAALWEALRAVDLEAFVRALPQGLDTPFQYQGANLSGGQRQRLGIARALLRNPDVLILDEATSALDTETRRHVVANLRARMTSSALVFITHERVIADEADVTLEL